MTNWTTETLVADITADLTALTNDLPPQPNTLLLNPVCAYYETQKMKPWYRRDASYSVWRMLARVTDALSRRIDAKSGSV